MRRLAFNFFSALSLLLCIFAIYSWLRSYLPSRLRFESVDGALMILSWEGEPPPDPQFDIYNPASEKFYGIRSLMSNMMPKSDKRWLGFRHLTGDAIFQGVTFEIIAIPYWVIIPPTAALPAIWLLSRRRRRHRLKGGQCLKCGYDLRESKEKCPECGTEIPAAAR
jgi:hypothetical protein